MREKHLALIKILVNQEEWQTAKQLSLQLHISERSVKNYIGEINYFENNLIEGSRKGYMIQRERGKALLAHQVRSVPETPGERVNYIITELLTRDSEGGQGIDLYDISEKIFVSYETLKKDMVKVRKKLKEYGLYANVVTQKVSMEGRELDKRRLLSSILYEEFNKNILSLDVVQNAFPDYDLEELRDIILTECKKYHYFINDYAMVNLILDVVISMDRIRKNCTFRTHMAERRRYGIREMELSEQIADRIEQAFSIRFTEQEIEELTSLLISHLMKVDYDMLNHENIREFIEPECLDIVDRVLVYLNENYFIDTENDEFVVKFTIHIHNLLRRMENQYTTKNPLTEHIKNSCPLIFECAVGVANCLSQLTGYKVDEDEIAYIALHIGGNLETYENQKDKLGCILLSPQYYDMADIMMEKIAGSFSEDLVIKTVVTKPSELSMAKREDMIISTIAVDPAQWEHVVQVNPFLPERDLSSIRRKISEVKQAKKLERLRKMLMQITSPELFCKNGEIGNQKQALAYMIRALEEQGYVDGEFIHEVEDREAHSSTAFGRLAVPHSLKMDANRTGMYILLSDKPIAWAEHMVNVVLLFAINREDRELFHEIFDNLIVLLLEYQNLDKVLQSNTYEEFIEAILERRFYGNI